MTGTEDASVPRLAVDIARLGLAVVAGAVVAAVVTGVLIVVRDELSWADLMIALFVFSAVSSAVYLIHTLVMFLPMPAARLRAVLVATTSRSRRGDVGEMLAGTGPTIAVQWSIIAIIAVLAFTFWPGLLEEPATVWLSVLVVAASWSVTLVAYAVHYARFDLASGARAFPDDHPRRFADYVYLAVQVQTTFSTSDVSLKSTEARSLVAGHTLISFAFNTVIIAMLITVLFLGVGGK